MVAKAKTAEVVTPVPVPVKAETPPVTDVPMNMVPGTYVPSTTNSAEIADNFRLAMAQTKAMAAEVETRGLTNLVGPVADYYAAMLIQTGTYPDEKQTRKFFADIISDRDLQTSRNTMVALVGMAVKCGALLAQVQRTSVFVAWYRVVNGKLEFTSHAEKPSGKGWERDVLCNVSVTRPKENKGKGKQDIWVDRNSAILPMTYKDINDAYNTLIIRKPATPDGKPQPAQKGADQNGSHGAGANNKIVTVAGAQDIEVLQAALNILNDDKRRDKIGLTEAGNNLLVDILSVLDTHINADGEYVPKKQDDKDSMLKKVA